ncbi:tRNA (guanine(37)-N1)-methyltransferase isoform X2 [Coccinella septempunctata]|uniref:tRNA (guanine(37)-N1)-methyltransferase isoform X2 n=1 Tax=Coccinella septempunctata TaxID=41139 RepID=UPI001D060995|nr:tRNA (guanine(37)-N1)-methyltransferase isoform X2 [Coccinella septempunctata]
MIFTYFTYISHVSLRSLRIMANSVLFPSSQVKGLKVLDKTLFIKTVKVPCLQVDKNSVSKAVLTLKKYFLKLENFKAVQSSDSNVSIYLNPDSVREWKNISTDDINTLSSIGISDENLILKDLTLTYDNYSLDTILKSILPDDSDGFSSFTKVGHIVHVNLKDHLLPYKKLIGEVLLEKVKNCKTVVNKLDMIDNTYRNFHMEVLCGEDNMQTCVKENNCIFEFDFSTVYWNSRLSTEHERIVKKLHNGDVFIDVFAGVGPFSVPLAKKKCYVYANDLNPESYKWLNYNIEKNKVDKRHIKTFNKDGRDFIKTDVKSVLIEHLNQRNIFIAMNLPALAVEFVDGFVGLLAENIVEISNIPIVYVYCFAKGSETNTDYCTIAKNSLLQNIEIDVTDKIVDMFEVRTVSNFKKMIRITLKLDGDILFASRSNSKRKVVHDDNLLTKIPKYNGEEKEQ